MVITFLFPKNYDPKSHARVRLRLVRHWRTCDSVGCSFWFSFFQTMKYRFNNHKQNYEEIEERILEEYKNSERKKKLRFLEKTALIMLCFFVIKVLFFIQ